MFNATHWQCFLVFCCYCTIKWTKGVPISSGRAQLIQNCNPIPSHWDSKEQSTQEMSSVSRFITRHPLITLISLVILYQLLTVQVEEDDDDILRVLTSALLLKSDDPHQKPQHFPELPEPPPPSGRRGGKRTRVLLLAYARFSPLSTPTKSYFLSQIRFILCWRTAHSCP